MRPRSLSPGRVWMVLGVWALLLLPFWVTARRHEEGALGLVQDWLLGVGASPLAGALLLVAFLLRPLLLLPITLMVVFAGFLFGPVWGALYSLVATTASASVAYGLARLLKGRGPVALPGVLAGLRERGFETVLVSRLVFVPGDLVNYSAGAVGVAYLPFLTATAIGGLPGLMMSVLAGASIEGAFVFGGVRVNVWYALASGALLTISLTLSRRLRRGEDREGEG